MIAPEHPPLYNRQKTLLALIQGFGGHIAKVDMQKYLFLFSNEFEQKPSYEFVPYRFGCFSFQSYVDVRKLTEFGLLVNTDALRLASKPMGLDEALKKRVQDFVNKYGHLKGDALIRHVYREYPYYATRSEIADRLMDDDGKRAIELARPKAQEPAFFTIGYEGNSFENYLNRLLKNDVRLLCDVRKNPLSRKYGFSKRTLSETVEKLGIHYTHLPELGIMSDKRQALLTAEDYAELFDDYAKTTLQQETEALQKLVNLVAKHDRVAITCFEAEHCMCHRSKIAEALSTRADWQFTIKHI